MKKIDKLELLAKVSLVAGVSIVGWLTFKVTIYGWITEQLHQLTYLGMFVYAICIPIIWTSYDYLDEKKRFSQK